MAPKFLVEKKDEKFIEDLVYNPLVNAVSEVNSVLSNFKYENIYDKKFFQRGPTHKPEETDLKYYLDGLNKDNIAEHQPRLLVLRLVLIYKKFYRDVARRAELLATGVEKIDRVIKGEAVDVVLQCTD